ncbi:hypothetical protein VTI74DRAFT_128 [Chaetomium olivicolor]
MAPSASSPSAPTPPALSPTSLRALTFDVFGTCVDWHTSITARLWAAIAAKKQASASSLGPPIPPASQARLAALTVQDVSLFAQQWHRSYSSFTRSFVPGSTPWKDVDAHHRDSLADLLEKQWGLRAVFDDEEIEGLSKVWHYLEPWGDSKDGVRRLNEAGFVTASLSNGNKILLEDLCGYAGLEFAELISAEDFKAYKPNREAYLGACRMLGLEPRQVAMVAAHLEDLAAAREAGMRTVYVERPGEEEWKPDEERYVKAREWVDLWVAEGDGGFLEVARQLGV